MYSVYQSELQCLGLVRNQAMELTILTEYKTGKVSYDVSYGKSNYTIPEEGYRIYRVSTSAEERSGKIYINSQGPVELNTSSFCITFLGIERSLLNLRVLVGR